LYKKLGQKSFNVYCKSFVCTLLVVV
jgi:hypothetical protein